MTSGTARSEETTSAERFSYEVLPREPRQTTVLDWIKHVALALILLTLVGFGIYIWHCGEQFLDGTAVGNDFLTLQSSIAFVAATVALSGLMLTHVNNTQHSRTQHTITLLNTRFSEPMHYQAIFCIRQFVGDEGIQKEQLEEAKKKQRPSFDIVFNVRSLANYYEMLAASLARKELDERLLFASLGTNVLAFYRMAWRFVHDARGVTSEYPAEATNPRQPDVYKNLLWLVSRWGEASVLEGGSPQKHRISPTQSIVFRGGQASNGVDVLVYTSLLVATVILLLVSHLLT